MTRTLLDVRQAALADLRRVAVLEQRMFRLEGPWTLRDLERDFRDAGRRYLVCEDQAELVGYASGSVSGRELEVSALAVDDAHRGCGVGRMLLERILDWGVAEGAEVAVLQVRTENVPAIALYESLGFAVTAELDEFYATGLDAFEMRAVLPCRRLSRPSATAPAD